MSETHGYGQEPTQTAEGQEPSAQQAPVYTQPRYSAPAENVRSIDEGPADYDLDARRVKVIRPYRMKFRGQWWTVSQPDVGTIMEAEQAPTAEAFMSLMFEDAWDELGPAFKAYADPGAIWEIARAISIHFDLDAASVRAPARNRRERREAPRRG